MFKKYTVPTNKEGLYFGWFARYMDSSVLEEFNENGTTKPFRNIEKDKVMEFGLYGSGTVIFFDTRDGVIQWKPDMTHTIFITPYLEDQNGRLEVLAPRTDQMYQDIIHYKHFVTYLGKFGSNGDSIETESINTPPIIDEYYVGYKCDMNTKFGDLHFQNMAIINLTKGMVLERLTFTPQFDFNGKIRIGMSGSFAMANLELVNGQKKDFEMILSTVKPNVVNLP